MNVKACSCSNSPHIFVENIQANHIIFAAEIVEHIVFKERIKYFGYYGITKLRVFHWFQNEMVSDTIYYVNGEGGMCHTSIDRFKVGTKMILKTFEKTPFQNGYVKRHNSENALNLVSQYFTKDFVGYGICDESMLEVEDNIVVGNITTNISRQNWKFERILSKVSDSLKDFFIKIKRRATKNKQSMNWNKFESLMERKWKSL